MRTFVLIAGAAAMLASPALATRTSVPDSENVTGRPNVSEVCDKTSQICVYSFLMRANEASNDGEYAAEECLKRGKRVVHNKGATEYEIAQIWTAGGSRFGQRMYMVMCEPDRR